MDALELQIASLPIASLRRNYRTALEDWSTTDTAVRDKAKEVLSEIEVDGDSMMVPTIEDIVDKLVKRIIDEQ